MLIYWFMFVVIAVFSFSQSGNELAVRMGRYRFNYFSLVYIILFLILGFRYKTGGDWGPYLRMNEAAIGTPITSVLNQDQAYSLLNWVGANLFGGVFLPNLVVAAVFITGLKKFCGRLPNSALALLVSLPYLVWVVGQGYTRQAGAIGFLLWAISGIGTKSIAHYYLLSILSVLFHKTAAIFLIFGIFSTGRKLSLEMLFICTGFVIFSYFIFDAFLSNWLASMLASYLVVQEAGISSSGATVRLTMTILSAFGVLFTLGQLKLTSSERIFWFFFSFAAVLLLLLTFFLPLTIVDRMGLYWLPVQIFFLSHLPTIFKGHSVASRNIVILGIVSLSATVQWVWLFFAHHAFAWIPYRFFPWEIIWSSI